MGKYRNAPAVAFISGNLVAFKLHNKMPSNTLSVSNTFHFLYASIQPFSCAVHSHMWVGCAVQLSDDEG